LALALTWEVVVSVTVDTKSGAVTTLGTKTSAEVEGRRLDGDWTALVGVIGAKKEVALTFMV
jgi:hypothetical protein